MDGYALVMVNCMAKSTPERPGGLLKTVLIGLLIIFGLALLVGTLTVLFP